MTAKSLILVDTSGSMAEEGKKSVIRYLLYAIDNFYKNEYSVEIASIYLWAEKIEKFELNQKIQYGGKADISTLSEFLKNETRPVLIITNGNYTSKVEKKITENISNKKIIAMLIGPDNNKVRLLNTFGAINIFETEDLFECLRFLNRR